MIASAVDTTADAFEVVCKRVSSLADVVLELDERTKIFKVAEEVEAAQKAAAETVKGAKAAGESLQADVNASKVKSEIFRLFRVKKVGFLG